MDKIEKQLKRNFIGFAYGSEIDAACAEDFSELVFKKFSPNKQDSLEKYLYKIRDLLNKNKIIKSKSVSILLKRDIQSILDLLSNYPNESIISLITLKEDLVFYCKCLKGLGINIGPVNLYLVKKFPAPYNNQKHWAMTFDFIDEKQYGISPGIYFRSEALFPFGSTAILAHELIHIAFSEQKSTSLARGLEEGIADVFSFLLLSKKYDNKIALNIMKNFRFYFPTDPLGLTYLQTLKSACYLITLWGPDRFMELVRSIQKNGRQLLIKLEKKLFTYYSINENIFLKSSPGYLSKRDIKKLSVFSSFISNFPYNYVVSPSARYIAEFCRTECSIKHIAKKSGLTIKETRKALEELESNFYLIILNDEKLVANECDLFLNARSLRYTCVGDE